MTHLNKDWRRDYKAYYEGLMLFVEEETDVVSATTECAHILTDKIASTSCK